jgi:hypothetical protein
MPGQQCSRSVFLSLSVMVLPLTKGPGGVGFPSRTRGSLNGLFTPLIATEKPLARDSRHAELRAFGLA